MIRALSLSAAACRALGSALQRLSVRPHIILLADTFRGPLDGDLVVAGVGLDPLLILLCALAQQFLGDGLDSEDIAIEVHEVLGPTQQRQIALDDKAVETLIYKSQ